MRRDVWVRDECCSNGCEGYEELGTEVCTQAGDKACGCRQRDLLLNVKVEAVKLVNCDYGVKRDVVCFKLAKVSSGAMVGRVARTLSSSPLSRSNVPFAAPPSIPNTFTPLPCSQLTSPHN